MSRTVWTTRPCSRTMSSSPLFADAGALGLEVERLGVIARGDEPAHGVLGGGQGVRVDGVDLVGQADARQRAARTFGAVFERRRNRAARRGHRAHGLEQGQRARREGRVPSG